MQQEREDLVDYWKRTGRKVLWGTLLRHELEAAMASEPRRRLRGLLAGSAGNR